MFKKLFLAGACALATLAMTETASADYCYGGGYLTAIDLNTRQTWQTSNDGRIRYPGRA